MKSQFLSAASLSIIGGICFCCLALNNPAKASTLVKVVDSLNQPMPDVTVTVRTVGFGINGTSDYKTDCDGQHLIVHFGGSSCLLLSVSFSLSKPGYTFSHTTGFVPCSSLVETINVVASGPPQPPRSLATVSAASYRNTFAPNTIAATFGNNLAVRTEAATSLPLPTKLADRTVILRDSVGAEKTASLFFVSPGQINFLLPPDLSLGNSSVLVIDQNQQVISTGCATVFSLAPGLFTAAATGMGLAAAVVLRVKTDGSQSYEPVAQVDAVQNRHVPVPIDFGPSLGPDSDQIFLVLFGNGWRNSNQPSRISVTIRDSSPEVLFAGPHPSLAGLDQINVRLSRALSGSGMVNITVMVEGHISNTVQVSIK